MSQTATTAPVRRVRRRRTSRDLHAGALIREFMAEAGMNAEDLADATQRIALERGKPRMGVSRRTIDRIVLDGHVPLEYRKAGIALVMGRPPWRIWGGGADRLKSERVAA